MESGTHEGELHWAAGLLEASGAFYLTARPSGGLQGRIQCRLADPDVLERLRVVLGAGIVNGPYDRPAAALGRKLTWIYQVNRRAEVVRLARRLKPMMGDRRQRQIAEMLEVLEGGPLATDPEPATRVRGSR